MNNSRILLYSALLFPPSLSSKLYSLQSLFIIHFYLLLTKATICFKHKQNTTYYMSVKGACRSGAGV